MKMYNWNTEMRFGKHKGQVIAQIWDEDPSYLYWCTKTIDNFIPCKELYEKIEKFILVDFEFITNADEFNKENVQELKEIYSKKEKALEAWGGEPEVPSRKESRHTYKNYGGSYAQDVEGYSDQDIRDGFGGEAEAYWNID